MSKPPSKTAAFLAAMRQSEVPDPDGSAAGAPAAEPEPTASVVRELPRPRAVRAKAPPRAGLKHFGGYLDDDTLEKIALLRVRLKKDNSELIKQAIDELYRKHNAKRAFGDA